MPSNSYTAGHFLLSLDGELGLISKVGGGNIKGEVVTINSGPENLTMKHISTLKFEPFSLDIGISMGKPLYEWIKASLDKSFIAKTGYVVAADFNHKAQAYRHFRDAHITEIAFPAMDAGAKEVAKFTIKVDPEEITYQAGDAADIKGVINTKQKKWLQSNFRFRITGLEDACKRVSKIDAFTVKQSVVQDDCGEFRVSTKHPAKLEIPNLKVTFSAADVKPWAEWFDKFVIKGLNGQEEEKQATLEYLDPATKEVLGTVNFKQVGIFSLNQEDSEANKDAVARYVAELYVEGIDLQLNYV